MSPTEFRRMTVQEFWWLVDFKNRQADPRPYGKGKGAMTLEEVEEIAARIEARNNGG